MGLHSARIRAPAPRPCRYARSPGVRRRGGLPGCPIYAAKCVEFPLLANVYGVADPTLEFLNGALANALVPIGEASPFLDEGADFLSRGV